MESSQDRDGELTWGDCRIQERNTEWGKRTWVIPRVGDIIQTYKELNVKGSRVTELVEDTGVASGLRVITENYPSGYCCSWVKRIVK